MKTKGLIKWIFALIVVAIIGFFGFVFKVNEGQCAVVTRFGAARAEITQAGMYFRLPWPFENVTTYDARKQYMDSGYLCAGMDLLLYTGEADDVMSMLTALLQIIAANLPALLG